MALGTNHYLSDKKVIIAGCGIAGSTFVSALHQLWPASSKAPEITVFDRGARGASLQHYPEILTLHGGSSDEGMDVLRRLRRLENIKADSNLASGYFNVWDEKWKFLSDIHPQPHGDLPSSALRIRRADLMKHLVDKAERVPTARFGWQCTCVAAERLANGQICVTVQETVRGGIVTATHECDLLIIADGVDGRLGASLRPHEAKMEYAGATQIGGISRLPQGLPLPIQTVDTGGLQMSNGNNTCCIYTPLDEHTLHWALSKKGPEREEKQGPFSEEEFAALKAEALDTGSMFAEPFRSIVEATDPATAFILPARDREPFAHQTSQPGVVFLGDANHVMSLYLLKGADMALKDGWDLAEQICRSNSMDAAIAAYDKMSIPRVEEPLEFSRYRIKFGHSTGALWKTFKYGMYGQRAFGLVGHKFR
ncbi:putative monooxygenase [Thozetella sp. PMI_491]|nr:putative monooxygenase [Thozetella sp. PMI_491]